MGKSIVGTEFAYSAALEGFGVIIHSLEMSGEQILYRMVSSHLQRRGEKISYERMMRPGLLKGQERSAIVEALRDLKSLPVHIEDAGGRTIAMISNTSERIANEFAKKGLQLGLVVIDHAHVVRFAGKYQSDVSALKEVTQGTLDLCKRLNTCVAQLAQCNRDADGRDDKRPRLSDIRAAGSFEEDSDVVLLLYRPAYYIERSDRYRRGLADEAGIAALADYERTKHLLEFIIYKNRSGRAGQVVEVWIDPALNAIRSEQPGTA